MISQKFFGLTTLAIALLGCAGIHRQQVAQMRANGDPRADCYDRCGPSGLVCMKECDNKQPLAGTLLQSPGSGGTSPGGTPEGQAGASGQPGPAIDQAAALQLLTEAAKVDEAKKREREAAWKSSNGSTPSSPVSTPPSTDRGASRTTTTRAASPASEIDCTPPCALGRRCVILLAGSKQCVAGPQCWTVEKTHGECR